MAVLAVKLPPSPLPPMMTCNQVEPTILPQKTKVFLLILISLVTFCFASKGHVLKACYLSSWWWHSRSESIEWFIEDQAFLRSYSQVWKTEALQATATLQYVGALGGSMFHDQAGSGRSWWYSASSCVRQAGGIMSCEHQTWSGEAEAVHPQQLHYRCWMGMICLVSIRLYVGPEEAKTVQATTLVFCVWLCGNTSWKRQARSGKLKLCFLWSGQVWEKLIRCEQLREVGGWDQARSRRGWSCANSWGGQVELCLVSISGRDMSCERQIRSGRSRNREFGVWVCRITSCKRQARSGKTEAVPATAAL